MDIKILDIYAAYVHRQLNSYMRESVSSAGKAYLIDILIIFALIVRKNPIVLIQLTVVFIIQEAARN